MGDTLTENISACFKECNILREQVERLQREAKNDLVAYMAAIDRQEEIRVDRDEVRAENERLKGGQGEPVAWMVGKCVWTYKADAVNHADGREVSPLYTSQPAPVSVEIIELLRDCKQEFGWDNTTLTEQIDACLDKVKELKCS